MHTVLLAALLMFPTFVHAATVSFDPQDYASGTGPFTVGVNLTADEGVNAIEVALLIPKELQPIDVSNGNSIILLWLTEPHFDEAKRLLTFRGIIPNGYVGTEGRLATITFAPQGSGIGTMALTAESRAYAGEGEPVTLVAQPLTLPVVIGKENIANTIPDTDPPETFTPIIVRDPQLAGGRATLVFSTTDKGSGIARYEVKEYWGVDLFPRAGWNEAKSPYVLHDQLRMSQVLVRAIDREGNTFTTSIAPSYPSSVIYITTLLLISCMLGFWYVRPSRTRA